MNIDPNFSPKEEDEIHTKIYPSGKLKEADYLRKGIPANGWSRKLYYERGAIQLQECFSNSLVIEQLVYDEEGNILSHKIYNHRLKQLIDKPVQTEVIRHNTVSGVAHMGFYFKHLSAISKFIESEYEEEKLEKAYHDFIHIPSPYDDMKDKDEKWEEQYATWGMIGKEMNFIIGFEHGEGYFHWELQSKSEENYERARFFMESLK